MPWQAQRGSRDIYIYPYLTSVLGEGGWPTPHLGHLTLIPITGDVVWAPVPVWTGMERKKTPPPTGVRSHKIEVPKAKAPRRPTATSFTYSLFPYDTSVSCVLTVTEGLPTTGVTFSCLPIKFPVHLIRFHPSNCVPGGQTSVVAYTILLRAGRSGDRFPVGWNFPCQSRQTPKPTQLPGNVYWLFRGVKTAGSWCWLPVLVSGYE
jgi:hypothetical protein